MTESMLPSTSIRRGVTTAADPTQAAAELYESLWQPELELAVFFCSPNYNLEALGRALLKRFGLIPLIGCTTAGEITPNGYQTNSLTGFSLAGPDFRIATRVIDNLEQFTIPQGQAVAEALVKKLNHSHPEPNSQNSFAFLLLDGMTRKAELVTAALHRGLNDIALVGGSAGANALENMAEVKTYIYQAGEFRTDRAVLTLVNTTRPFLPFKTENFVPTETKMVITAAQPEIRKVSEINAEPAAAEYIRLVGAAAGTPVREVSAAHPVGVLVGGQLYLRAIGWVHEDQSLTFTCAIDEGVVLTLGQQMDFIKDLQAEFDNIRHKIGQPELVLAFDCVSRLWDMLPNNWVGPAGELMKANNAIGFSTFGEQYNSMFMNQTLTGIALGRRANHGPIP